MYDDEIFTVATLSQLATLGRIFGVEPRALLVGPDADAIARTITFAEISLSLERLEFGRRPDQLGDEIGFSVEPLLTSPEALWDYDVEGLYNICKFLGID